MENPTPDGFTDETAYETDPWTQTKTLVSLAESQNWKTDIVLNYTKPEWNTRVPNPIQSDKDMTLNFEDHTLRIYSGDMVGGTGIRAVNGSISLSGQKLEVFIANPAYGIHAHRDEIALDVDEVWLEAESDGKGTVLVRAQSDITLNSQSFVAQLGGQLQESFSENPSETNAIFSAISGGNLTATGENYFLHVAEGTKNSQHAVGVYAGQSSTITLGKPDQALNLLSVTGVGCGFYFQDYGSGKFFVNADNLYVETVSDTTSQYGTAIYADGEMAFKAKDAVLKGDILINPLGMHGETSNVDLIANRVLVSGNLLNGQNGRMSLSADALTFNGNMSLNSSSLTTINADQLLLNGNIANSERNSRLEMRYARAYINGRVAAGRGAIYTFESNAAISNAQLNIIDTRAYDTLAAGDCLANDWNYDAVLAGDFSSDNSAAGSAIIDIKSSALISTHDFSHEPYIPSSSFDSAVVSALRANADSTINLVTAGASYRIIGNVTAGLGINPEDLEQGAEDFTGGRINLGGENTHINLNGDVFAANGGAVALQLGQGDYFEGRVDTYADLAWSAQTDRQAVFKDHAGQDIDVTHAGQTEITLKKGSTWVAHGKNIVTALHAEDNSVINLTKDTGSSLLIEHFAGVTDLTLHLDSDPGKSSMLYLDEVAADSKVNLFADLTANISIQDLQGVRFATVKGSASTNVKVKVQDQGFFNAAFDVYTEAYDKDDESNLQWNGSANGSDGKIGDDVVDAFVGDDDAVNWVVGKISESSVSDAGQAVIATARGLYYSAVEIDRFNQRYGDRRYDENNKNLWARVRQDRWGTAAGVGDFKSQNTTYQLGFDYTTPNEDGKMIYGIAVDLMDGNTDYESIDGSGETKRYAVSAYATYMDDSGSYLDVVGKIGRLSNEYAVKLDSGADVSADYMNWMAGISVEVGHQLTADDSRWFVEPQVQAQYVFVSDNDYTNGQTQIEQDSIHSFITRAGFRAGRWLGENKAANVYFKGDVLHEWAGQQSIHVSDKTTVQDGENIDINNHGTWFDVGFGFQAPVGKSFYAFGDAEYRFGNDLYQTWTFNLGGKYVF